MCFVFHAFQPCNLSMRHSTHLYIVECTPDLVSVIHLDSYSNCKNSIGSTCLLRVYDTLTIKFLRHHNRWLVVSPCMGRGDLTKDSQKNYNGSLIAGFNHSDKLRENQQCLKPQSKPSFGRVFLFHPFSNSLPLPILDTL